MPSFDEGLANGINSGTSSLSRLYQMSLIKSPQLNTDGTHDHLGVDQGDFSAGYSPIESTG